MTFPSHNAFQQRKVCVVIPTYNNAGTLLHVIESVLQFTNAVIVVNDGSTDSTSLILEKFSVTKVQYSDNKGKGYALRTGFQHAMEKGYEYAITIDSDGQHYAEDLPKFVEALDSHPNSIIIGARNLTEANAPGKSNFGNKFSNFWFWVETGIRRSDTQSGYRLYPLKALSEIRFFTNKFEFEIEVLVRSAWRGIAVTEIPVKVFYAEKSSRVSHFRPLRDFTRISILNSILVTVALLYIKPRDFFRNLGNKKFRQHVWHLMINPAESDASKAASVGFGVFMGIVPIWGFQMLVALGLAFLLRLNKAIVIVAANISIPPMIPLILYLSHWCGKFWMGKNATDLTFSRDITFETIQKSFIQYLFGAVTLAVIAGFAFGLVTFLILKLFRKPLVQKT